MRRCLTGDEGGALVGEVGVEGIEGTAADGDEAGFVAFSGDSKEAVLEVEMFETGVADFGKAEAGGIEEFEDGEVSAAESFGGVDGGEELGDGFGVECFGEFGGGLGGEDGFGGIDFDDIAFLEKAEEDLEVDEGDTEGGGVEFGFAKVAEKAGEFVGAEVAPFFVPVGFAPG